MMGKKRWFRFHIDRWLNGTFGLKPNEIAAYITLLCELYDNGGKIPLEYEVMARRCGMRPTSFAKAVERLVEVEKVEVSDGFLTCGKVVDEIVDSDRYAVKSRAKVGEKSVKSRAKLEQNSPKNAIKTRENEKYPPVLQTTEYRNNKITTTEIDPRDRFYHEGFVFEGGRWFAEHEVVSWQARLPSMDVAGKLADKSFQHWCYEKDRTNPKLIAKRFLEKQERCEQIDSDLAQTLIQNQEKDWSADIERLMPIVGRKVS